MTIPFNPSVGKLELQVDASKSGLGAVFIQNKNIISFSSRSLNTTEQKYSQIEKELYAIVFGIRHFHQYLYGHSFVVVTDHKPLETLINQPMQKSSCHQRMLLQIQPYDLTVIFQPGKEIPVPDTLSRLYLQSQDEKLKQGQSVEAQIQGKSWEPAVVLHKHELPRSYIMQTQDMKAYRQNRKYMRMSPDETDLEQYQHTNSNGVPQLSSTSSPNALSTPSKSPPSTVLIQAPGSSPK
ncbi:hypothetical protein QYM36_005624, partial [Artemia franciscana]